MRHAATTGESNTLQRQGFTLVELLISMAIIALLTTISLLAYNGVQARARDATVLSSTASWERILRLRLAEQRKLPYYSPANGDCSSVYSEDGYDLDMPNETIYRTNDWHTPVQCSNVHYMWVPDTGPWGEAGIYLLYRLEVEDCASSDVYSLDYCMRFITPSSKVETPMPF